MGYSVPIVADVTTLEQRPPVHPEQIAALEARGFRVLGRFATLTRPTRDDTAYAKPERERLDDWRQRPAATVLVAPDGTAFAGVDVFGEARMLRLRTELDDGSVVETVGVEREGALLPRWGQDPFATFQATATADHAFRLVEDPAPDVVLAEHDDHLAHVLARRDARPLVHADRDHALRLASAGVAHLMRVNKRYRVIFQAVCISLVVLIGVVFSTLEFAPGTSTSEALLLDLVMVVVAVVSVGSVIVFVLKPLSRMQWWRPPYLVDH
jgi:hypothetical protein